MPAHDPREARKREANPEMSGSRSALSAATRGSREQNWAASSGRNMGYERAKGSMSNANSFTKRIMSVCMLLMVPVVVHAQGKQLVDIAVTCKESIGNSFVFQFKEAIRSSASYTLTPADSAPRPTLFVDIVCVDVSPETSEPATAVSVIAYTFKLNKNKRTNCNYLTNSLVYHGVRYMTHRFTKESAVAMLADLDEQNNKQP